MVWYPSSRSNLAGRDLFLLNQSTKCEKTHFPLEHLYITVTRQKHCQNQLVLPYQARVIQDTPTKRPSGTGTTTGTSTGTTTGTGKFDVTHVSIL